MKGSAPDLSRYARSRRVLRSFLARRGEVLVPLSLEARRDLQRVQETRRQVPLLMDDASALHLQACVRAVRHLGGAMAEAGVLMGGSARLICEAKGDAPLHLFDVFDMPLDPEARGGEGEVAAHFGPVRGSRADVEALLSAYEGVSFHPGVFPGSAENAADERFAFVHLDMDLVSSTQAALDFFVPRMLAGGILIGDDYGDPGVRGCFEHFFAGRPDTLVALPWDQAMAVI